MGSLATSVKLSWDVDAKFDIFSGFWIFFNQKKKGKKIATQQQIIKHLPYWSSCIYSKWDGNFRHSTVTRLENDLK